MSFPDMKIGLLFSKRVKKAGFFLLLRRETGKTRFIFPPEEGKEV